MVKTVVIGNSYVSRTLKRYWVRKDVTWVDEIDDGAIDGADIVIYLGLASVQLDIGDWGAESGTKLREAMNVIDVCRDAGVKRFIGVTRVESFGVSKTKQQKIGLTDMKAFGFSRYVAGIVMGPASRIMTRLCPAVTYDKPEYNYTMLCIPFLFGELADKSEFINRYITYAIGYSHNKSDALDVDLRDDQLIQVVWSGDLARIMDWTIEHGKDAVVVDTEPMTCRDLLLRISDFIDIRPNFNSHATYDWPVVEGFGHAAAIELTSIDDKLWQYCEYLRSLAKEKI